MCRQIYEEAHELQKEGFRSFWTDTRFSVLHTHLIQEKLYAVHFTNEDLAHIQRLVIQTSTRRLHQAEHAFSLSSKWQNCPIYDTLPYQGWRLERMSHRSTWIARLEPVDTHTNADGYCVQHKPGVCGSLIRCLHITNACHFMTLHGADAVPALPIEKGELENMLGVYISRRRGELL